MFREPSDRTIAELLAATLKRRRCMSLHFRDLEDGVFYASGWTLNQAGKPVEAKSGAPTAAAAIENLLEALDVAARGDDAVELEYSAAPTLPSPARAIDAALAEPEPARSDEHERDTERTEKRSQPMTRAKRMQLIRTIALRRADRFGEVSVEAIELLIGAKRLGAPATQKEHDLILATLRVLVRDGELIVGRRTSRGSKLYTRPAPAKEP